MSRNISNLACSKSNLILLFTILWFSEFAFSSGFQLTPTTSGISRVLGGNGIIGDDLGDMFYNPAGLSLQSRNAIQGDFYHIKIENKFINNGSTQSVVTALGPLTLPLAGGANSESSDTAVAPIVFVVYKLPNNLTFGLGITTPMGLSATYKNDWLGRYHTTETELNVIDINPAISKRVNDHLIVAGGISVQYASAELSQAVPTATPGVDIDFKSKGDDVNLGFNLGTVYSLNSGSRFGLAYRSKISHDLSGDSTQNLMGVPIGSVKSVAPITLPESIYLSYYQTLKGPMDLWSIGAGIRWTNWSRFKEIRIKFEDGTSDVMPQNWEDTLSYGISTDYRISDRTKLIFSLGYEESAVANPTYRTPQIPDSTRRLVGFGVDRKINWRNSEYLFGFGWQRIMLDNREINRTRPLSANFSTNLSGEFKKSDIDVFSIKLIKDW